MNYEFTYKLETKDLFQSSLYYTMYSVSGVIYAIISIIAIVVLIYTLITGVFFSFAWNFKFILIFGSTFCTILQPLILYIKVLKREKKNAQKEITLGFNDQGIHVKFEDKKASTPWSAVRKVVKRPTMLIIFMDSIHGHIIPNRILLDKRNEFYNYTKNLSKVNG
ncbi:MAG: YcxB family protein [Eubacteriales bacterium]|nr:YcxB family protein [Eubacteriales bacterium]